jgi:hypothetical protein
MIDETRSLIRRLFGRIRLHKDSIDVMRIRAVAFQEDGFWCAQCLEHDIAVQAEDLPKLRDALEQALIDQIQISVDLGIEPFAAIPPAPEVFFTIYESAVQQDTLSKSFAQGLGHFVSEGLPTKPVVCPEMRLFTGPRSALPVAACQ